MELKHADVHFEPSDIHGRGVIWTGIGVLVVVWLIGGVLYFLFEYFAKARSEESGSPLPITAQVGHEVPLPPEPRLQESPRHDLQEVRAAAESALNSYSWVDRQKGIVAIPIDRAIDLVAQRGIPSKKAPPNMFFVPRAGDRLTGFEGKPEQEPR